MNELITYQPDIDGLRAIAVLLVVFYHFGLGPHGGFIGVDIFFVISGYLITKILYREIANGQFTLLTFYGRRMRRILPALLVVIGTSMVAGWFLLTPGDYDALGQQAASAAIGVSNFYFWTNTGYFDQSADLLPLLHTWSLAVEEQFYLVWPLMMLALQRSFGDSKQILIVALCGIITASFVASVVMVENVPIFAFYLLPTRAWELALGALLAFAPVITSRALSQLMPVAGLTLVGFAGVSLTAGSLFPGWNALGPCVGAALVIWPRTMPSITAAILSARPAILMGKISYSLYLWHWPLLVFYRHYINQGPVSAMEASFLLTFAVVIAYCSWKFIETPFRLSRLRPSRVMRAGFASMVLVAAPALAVSRAQGLPSRLPQELMPLSSLRVMWDFDCSYAQRLEAIGETCILGASWDKAESRLVLWGDSNAAHLAPIVGQAIGSDTSVALYDKCPATMGGDTHRYRPDRPDYYAQCIESRRKIFELLSTGTVDGVILAASWADGYLTHDPERPPVPATGREVFKQALLSTVEEIKSLGVKAILVGNFPGFSAEPISCYTSIRTSLLRQPCDQSTLTITADFHATRRGSLDGVFLAVGQETGAAVILPSEKICTEICLTELNGEFLYRDRTHLRRNLQTNTLRMLASRLDLQATLN